MLPAPLVLVTSFTCHVKAGKEAELQVSLGNLIGRTRALPGCLACRLVAAAEDPRALTLVHEWSDRGALHRFLDSAEYRVLADTYVGEEGRWRYGVLLLRTGRGAEADAVFQRMLRNANRMPEHYREAQGEWLALAEKEIQPR